MVYMVMFHKNFYLQYTIYGYFKLLDIAFSLWVPAVKVYKSEMMSKTLELNQIIASIDVSQKNNPFSLPLGTLDMILFFLEKLK